MGNAKYVLIGVSAVIIIVLLAFAARTIFAGGPLSSSDGQNSLSTTTPPAGIRSASGPSAQQPVTGSAAGPGSATTGNVQQATLALIDFRFTLSPNKIIKGVPVRVTVDASTLSGCMTTVVIRDFGVIKHITPSDNIIEFTPDKTGTFWITCSMGMGPGSFEVVNPDGTSSPSAAASASPPPSVGGSCGAGGGGCGCGG